MAKWTLGVVGLCGFLIAGVSLHAHHSLAGVYALGKEAKVTGEFKAFKFVNPHSSMKLDVKNADGTTTKGHGPYIAPLPWIGVGIYW